MESTCTDLAVPTLTMLAREINDAHQQVETHARGMLLEAKRAGDSLIEAKRNCPHGVFKAWVEENCSVSYRTAATYMKVAKEWDQKCSTLHISDPSEFSLRDFLNNKPKPKVDAPLPFTKDDAEHAQKLHALATRGATDGEREGAQRKLDKFAEGFGKSADALVKEADEVAPEPEPLSPMDELIQEQIQPFRKQSKERLVEMLLFCMYEHPELFGKLKEKL